MVVPIEPVSLAIGAVSLATLFSLSVECFDLIQTGRNLGADYELLLVKLSIEKRRLMVWGEAVGILRPDQDRDPLLDDPETHQLVERILMNVQKIFIDTDGLRSKYGLESASDSQTVSAATITGSSTCGPEFESSPFVQFQRRVATFHHKAGLLAKTRWAIRDSSKFAKMVEHLRDLHDGLGRIAISPRTSILKGDLVRRETESIPDLRTLNIIEETCSDADWKSSASAASLYLRHASYITPAKRNYIAKWMDVGGDQQRTSTGSLSMGLNRPMQRQRSQIRSPEMSPERPSEDGHGHGQFQNRGQKIPGLKRLNRPFLSETEIVVACSSATLVAWIAGPRDDNSHFHPIRHVPEVTAANRMTYTRIMKAIHVPPGRRSSSVAIYCPPQMQFVHLALCFVQEQLSAFGGEIRYESHIRFDDRLLDEDTCVDNVPGRMQGYYRDLEDFVAFDSSDPDPDSSPSRQQAVTAAAAAAASPAARPIVDAIDMSWLEQRIDVVTLPHWRPLSETLDLSSIFRQTKDDGNCIAVVVIAGEAACRAMLNAAPVTPPDNFRGDGRVYRLRELDGVTPESVSAWKAEHHCNIATDREFERRFGKE